MATVIDPVLVGVDPATGLEMWRQGLGFFPDFEANTIKCVYKQFFLSNDVPINTVVKCYYIINNPSGFDDWYNFMITQPMVGTALGKDIIIPAMDGTLQALPFDVPDGYILTDPQP